MTPRFEIGKAADGTYYFHLKAANGKDILLSGSYVSRSEIEKDIASAKVNARLSGRYERKEDVNGRTYFVLRSANNEVIGSSPMYSSPADMEKGIQSAKTDGPDAIVVDFTLSKVA